MVLVCHRRSVLHNLVLFLGVGAIVYGSWEWQRIYREIKALRAGQNDILKPTFTLFGGLILSAVSFAL